MQHLPGMQPMARRWELPDVVGLGGAVAGFLAGTVMVILSPVLSLLSGISVWTPPKLIAATWFGPAVANTPDFDVAPVLVGTATHFAISIVLGLVFGIVFHRWLHLTTDFGTPILVGLCYGLLIFLLGYAFFLPVFNPTVRDFLVAPLAAQNIVFGIFLGLFFIWLRPQPYAERPIRRSKRP